MVKIDDEENYVYSGYGLAFDRKGLWSFNDDFSRNVMILGVDNSSSSHTDKIKNDFLILGEGPTYGINGSFGAPEKKFSINFAKAKTKFCLSLHYNADNSYLFVNGKETYKFKASKKKNNFLSRFCLGSYLMNLIILLHEKCLLKETCMIFQLIMKLLTNPTF